MLTLNVCIQIYMNKKNKTFIKSTNISLLFRSFDKASEKKRNICTFYKFCVFFIHVYIYIEREREIEIYRYIYIDR